METDSDRKRKKDSEASTDGEEKLKKKAEVSSSSSSGDRVRASHILIKHRGSRSKASWKDPKGRAIRERTREKAYNKLKSLRDDVVSGRDKFNDLAFRYSDCKSAKRGGDLGPLGRGKMEEPFEAATYALEVGEVSDIVDTDNGVHIIMRTG